ncbi:MAG: DNA mismatch repair protein MutS [Candidatus Izimaplasma sp.]|nr:DNA mismatch repair protein MutS [Candidatus Izimaplasma bacterium]
MSKYTPMMQQYLKIKKDYSDYIVFFRLGDFYEMFFQDAIIASKELEIVLTGRDAGAKEKVPMCGIPYHSANTYLEKLVNKGYKVAIAEQTTEPTKGKGIVERDVVKLITPGTVIEEGLVNQKDNNYIVAISETKSGFILAYSDLTTGENFLQIIPDDLDVLFNEILSLNVKEVVVDEKFNNKLIKHYLNNYQLTISVESNTSLKSYYRNLVADIYDLDLLKAFARLINYLERTQKQELLHLQKVEVYQANSYLRIDNNSKINLELTKTMMSKSEKSTLFWLLDKCKTAMGSRYLKQTIQRPLIDKILIEKRYSLVESFNDHFIEKAEIIDLLKKVYDLERIVGRLSFGNCNAKDLVNLKNSLEVMPKIKDNLINLDNDYSSELANSFPELSNVTELINNAIIDNPPLTIKEGNFIKPGYSEQLDEIKSISENAKAWLDKFVKQEREKTGIKNLKVGYNKVFGYYIEISKGQISQVKPEFGYDRKQTLTNSERYITDELKEKEAIILGSKEKTEQLEYELFVEIRESVQKETTKLQTLARKIALVDMLIAFSTISMEKRYIKPNITNSKKLEIIDGRHPVVEAINSEVFIENSLTMDEDNNILLITGPNMSGKSTYMRQTALIIIMAQMGCFVPAKSAEIFIIDQIFTRIGASDDLSSGQSTFMVEMNQVNYALKNATEKSIILFDEIGRGTATYDGMALAQAIIEYCHHKLKAKILFSTHYHELTYLEDGLKTLRNVHVKAKEENGNIVFLHKVAKGPTDRSYGIHVAKLAKMPKVVIERSTEILKELEKNHGYNVIKPQTIDLFNYLEATEKDTEEKEKYASVIEQLKTIDILDITPLNAMNILNDAIEEIKKIDKKDK